MNKKENFKIDLQLFADPEKVDNGGENPNIPTPPENNIEEILNKKLAEQKLQLEKEWQDKLDLKLKEKDDAYNKQIEDILLEQENNKVDQVQEDGKIDENKKTKASEFAEKLLEKRKKEREEAERIKREKEEEAMKAKLSSYELKEKLNEMFKEEPWMEEPVLAGLSEGIIKNENDIKIYFNEAIKNKLKMAYAYEQATKKAGADPMSIYTENNIVTQEIVDKQQEQEKVKAWQKKLGII